MHIRTYAYTHVCTYWGGKNLGDAYTQPFSKGDIFFSLSSYVMQMRSILFNWEVLGLPLPGNGPTS